MQRLLACTLVVLVGCGGQDIPPLDMEERFRLELGVLEDELDLFLHNGLAPPQATHLTLQEGLFYILNGPRAKLMQFTSYGDLLFLLYHPELNPPPQTLQVVQGEGVASNRRAVPFVFNGTGVFTVGPDGALYVEDQVPRDRLRDPLQEIGSVVLRFDRNGQYLDYLGQEGIAGTPFRFIHSLRVNDHSDLIVLSRTVTALEIFVFDRSGDLIRHTTLPWERLPAPPQVQGKPVFEFATCDWSEPLLYLQVAYLQDLVDTESMTQLGIQILGSWILVYDWQRETFGESFPVPRVTLAERAEDPSSSWDRPVELLGTARGGHFFFLSQERPSVYRLMITNHRGTLIEQRTLGIPSNEMFFTRFSLASNGTLGALLSDGSAARAVWWRLDRLLSPFHATPR